MTFCLILFGRAPRSGRMVACTQAAAAYCLEALLTLLLLVQNSLSAPCRHFAQQQHPQATAPVGPKPPEFQQVFFDQFLSTNKNLFTFLLVHVFHVFQVLVFRISPKLFEGMEFSNGPTDEGTSDSSRQGERLMLTC